MNTESKLRDNLVEIFSELKWTNIIDGLTPSSTFTLDPEHLDFLDIYLEAGPQKFLDLVKDAVFVVMAQKKNGRYSNYIF